MSPPGASASAAAHGSSQYDYSDMPEEDYMSASPPSSSTMYSAAPRKEPRQIDPQTRILNALKRNRALESSVGVPPSMGIPPTQYAPLYNSRRSYSTY